MILSIIVPVYNVEHYIQECISSILKIDIKNMEILVIDDGSKDNSIKKINNIKDDRIRIISQSNKGLSAARNKGIKEAKGKYIYFIDSDDYIENRFDIVDMIDLAEKNELDYVIGNGYYYWNEDKKIKIYNEEKKPKKQIIEDVEAYVIDALKNHYYQDMVWLNLYKKDLLLRNKLEFLEGHYHEDVDWTTRVLLKANKIGFIDNNLYIYRQREGSITKDKKKSIQLAKDKMYMAQQIYEITSKLNNLELKNILEGRASQLYFWGAISGRNQDRKFFKKSKLIKLNEDIHIKELKKWIKLFNFSPELTYIILKIKEKICI